MSIRRLSLLVALLAACSQPEEEHAACFPGTLECQPDGVRICNGEGTGWQPSTCSEAQVCIAGTCDDPSLCPDACRDLVCSPGERRCVEDVFIHVCNETGTGFDECGNCAAPPINGICYQGDCVQLCQAQQKTYIGCDYFAVDLDNANLFAGVDMFGNEQYLDAHNRQYAVVVSNPDPQVSAFISVTRGVPEGQAPVGTCAPASEPDDSLVEAVVLPPKGLHIFALPARNIDGTMKGERAYRVSSNLPITAYQFNPLENEEVFSNDASLLLPTTALGTEYYVMTRGQTFDVLKGYLTVVGVDPEPTEVTVTVTAKTLAGEGIPAMMPGDTFTTTLAQFEVLNIETNRIGADLTGSFVSSNKPVSVFGGSEAANAPSTSLCDTTTNKCAYDGETSCACPPGNPDCEQDELCRQFITCCADHLEMQLFPIAAWGTTYVAVRSYPRGNELDVWRIIASQDDTQVTLLPAVATVPTLNAGEWFEFESGDDFTVDSTKPVMVGQFLAAEQAPNPGTQAGDAGTGDPTFILIAPTRQFRTEYVFLAPNKYEFDYVSIAAPGDGEVRLDGTDIDELEAALVVDVGTSGWRAIRIAVSDGFHTLSCPGTCSVMVHGYDQYVSYGYPGGLNLDEEDGDD